MNLQSSSSTSQEGVCVSPVARPTQEPCVWKRRIQSQGALATLALLLLFGGLRYDEFLGTQNIAFLSASTSKFGLIAIGMAFVIMSGGIDLWVGRVGVLARVVAAQLSHHGVIPAMLGGVAAGLLAGLFNGIAIARFKLMPFVVTLCTFLAARGLALVISNRETVAISYETGFDQLADGVLLGVPVPVWIAGLAFALGALVLGFSRFGRGVLAVGGNEEAARLMGLPVERIKVSVYALSGALAGLAGVLLAAQTSGSPTESAGWGVDLQHSHGGIGGGGDLEHDQFRKRLHRRAAPDAGFLLADHRARGVSAGRGGAAGPVDAARPRSALNNFISLRMIETHYPSLVTRH